MFVIEPGWQSEQTTEAVSMAGTVKKMHRKCPGAYVIHNNCVTLDVIGNVIGRR